MLSNAGKALSFIPVYLFFLLLFISAKQTRKSLKPAIPREDETFSTHMGVTGLRL